MISLIIKTIVMVLGELPSFKNLYPGKQIATVSSKSFARHIPLSSIEVVQLFHLTHSKNRESILTYGLVPTAMPFGFRTYPPRIYMSAVYADLPFGYVGNDNLDVWTFFLPAGNLMADEVQYSGNHYYIEESIPWYKLYLHETIVDLFEKFQELG